MEASNISIRFLEEQELPGILPFAQMLNPKLNEALLLSRLEIMRTQGYRCVGIFVEEELAGITGLWSLCKLYVGKHLEPDNVIIHPQYRGKGLGKHLFEFINQYAISEGYEALELNCYVNNSEAHKFWMNEGYRILGFHFQKRIHDR